MQLLNEMSWKDMVRFLFNDLLLLLRGLEPLLLLFLSENIVFVEIPKSRSFDIDCYKDLKICETFINSKVYINE